MVNLFPIGQAPLVRGTPAGNPTDTLAVQVNKLLQLLLDGLECSLGVTILRFDVAGQFDAILRSPEDFGLANVTDPACPGCGFAVPTPDAEDTLVPTPDEYVWWDLVHWTRAVHAILGNLAAEVVLDGQQL